MGGALGLAFAGREILSGIAYVVKNVADFEHQMNKVAAVSGASAKELKALTDNAKFLGRTTQFTANQIGEMQEVLARMGKTSKQIINVTESISKLAIATDTELAPAAELVSKTLNAFNLTSYESERVANVLAEATANTALNMETLGVSLSYSASAAKNYGWTVEQTASALGILIDNGIDASKAGTALRTIFIELARNGMTFEEAMTMISNSSNKTKTAFDLFGKTATNQATILADNIARLSELNEKFSDSTKGLNEMAEIMQDDLIGDLARLDSAWDGLIKGASTLNTLFRDTVKWLKEIVENISGQTRMDDRLNDVAEAAKALGYELNQFEKADIRRGVGEGFATGEKLLFLYRLMLENKEKEAKRQEEIANKLKKQREEQQKINQLWAERYEDRERLGNPMEAQITYAKMAANSNDAVDESIKRLNSSMKQAAPVVIDYQKNLEKLGLVAINLGEILQSAVATGITEMARAIGEAIVGVGNFGEKVLKIVGGFLEELGAAFIAAGTSAAIVQAELAVNPYAAIAAGAALVAIGAALSAQVEQSSKGFGASGGSFRSSYASSGSNSIAGLTNDDPLKLEGEFVLRGNDLVAAINKNNTRNGRVGGATITTGG